MRWIYGNTVEELEESAAKSKRFLEEHVLSMTLSGGMLADYDKSQASYLESLIFCPCGEMVYEVNYVMG